MSTLVIVGHPDLTTSRMSAALCAAARSVPGTSIRVLSDVSTDGRFDVHAEQQALTEASDIVLLYPTYWYSTPGQLKRWMDEVFTRGWAYGTGGAGALVGKTLRIVTTTGGAEDAYQPGRLHSFEYDAILAPLKATAHRLGMLWAEPLVIHAARDVTDEQLTGLEDDVRDLLDSSYQALSA
ncbi:NAD(P)H-dependent oxidoreductase [Subtercola lobariae]|uniref:NAD(P)H oxidoreductase n=1 Tax=Subtercola lobariae TaxID=1588641 RepID=A0A917B9M2_9MICO|nr:NAD(P)H-dependent oxidoreductase [Subtercola lobariae]GGF31598.1 NAD(P)H oxidoreductase [Subtercola lobariae]